MKLTKLVFLTLILSIASISCSNDGDNNTSVPTIDMGNDSTGDPTYKNSDSAAELNTSARKALCAKIIDEVGNPGDTIKCDPNDIVLPSAAACAESVKNYPSCAKVKDLLGCLENQYACKPTGDKCKFLEFDSCGVKEKTELADLSTGDKELLCDDMLKKAGGSGKTIECDEGLPLTVPSSSQCVAQIEEGETCANVETLEKCYDDIYSCKKPNREKCWFLIGGDTQCVPPYEGPKRTPSAFFSFPPIPVSCDKPGAIQRIPFTFSSTDAIPIVTGDIVGTRTVVPNVSIDAQTITFTKPRIMKVSKTSCTDHSDCTSGFKCATAGEQKFCTRQTGIEFVPGSVKLDYDPGVFEEKKQLVGVLIENTSGLEGRLPTSVASLYDADGKKDLLTNVARATDAANIRKRAIKSFFSNLASVVDAKNTLMTVWFFAGDVPARARPLINDKDLQDHFTSDLSVGSALVEALPTTIPRPSNVYQSILSMYEKDFGLKKYEDHEKFLFVFTDGPNEVYDAKNSYNKVLDESRKLGVHIFIIHLDTPIDATTMRDLPAYYLGNQKCQDDANCGASPCGGQASCQAFEQCRQVNVYGKKPEDGVTKSAQQYCIPTYNTDGQLGPIDEYADLGCQTNGNYLYVSDVKALSTYWARLPTIVNGQFSIQAEFSALQDPALKDEYYRFSSILVGGLGNGGHSHRLQAKDGFRPDTRPLVRISK